MTDREEEIRPPTSWSAFFEAALLFAAYAMGYPWFAAWCGRHLPPGRGRWVLEEALSLGLVALMVSAFRLAGARTTSWMPPIGPRQPQRAVLARALLLLGLLALAFRWLDPAFDEAEFALRGMSTPGALAELLAMLPFGVAAEELIFRFCQARLRHALGAWPAVLAISLAFALYHRVPGTPWDRHEIETLAGTFAGGLVLASAYERIGRLLPLIALHLAYDLLAVLQAWLHVTHQSVAEFCLFLVWIGASWMAAGRPGLRAPASRGDGTESREMSATRGANGTLVSWLAALLFGAGWPAVLAWIRLRLGF
jgi:membrane protease YdiL (CAAX protease family)